jgi:flagellar hook-length control protein FliK
MSNNLPITLKAPQAPAKPAQATPQAEDNAPQGKPFGDVLARQVAEAAPTDGTASPKKMAPKTAEEIFAQLKASTDAAAIVPSDIQSTLPTDMLAALLPQVSLPPTQSAAPADTGAVAKQTTPAMPGNTKVDLGVTTTATPSSGAAQVAPQKDIAFASMMEKMTAVSANQQATVEETLIQAAAQPQPTATALATVQSGPLNPVNVMPAQVTINTPVTHDKWGDEFNQKITWLATSKEQSAELHLNPPQLGPMDVVLKVSGDQATALFTSPHAAVREAIEQALPKLREMMADNGIMLGNATVSDQSSRNEQNASDRQTRSGRTGGESTADTGVASITSTRVSPISRHNGIVDTFA